MMAIEAEIENVRAAWEWAVTEDKLEEMDRALEGLSYFYETKCWYDQAAVLFRTAAEVLATRLPSERRQILWAKICAKQGVAQWRLSDEGGRPAFSGTTQLLEQCLSILQRSGESRATGDVFLTLSGLVGEPRLGQKLRTTALAIYEKNGERWHMARTLEALGFNANIRGQYEDAKQYYRRGIELCKEIGEQRKLGDIQAVLAEVHRALGEYTEATVLAHASLDARTAVANQRGIAYSLYVLGATAWRMGNLEEANRYSRQSRDVFIAIGLLGGVDFALGNLGNIACTLGDYAEARRQFQKILESNLTRNVLAESQNVPWALAGMAEVLRQEGQPEQAIGLIEHVLRHPNAWQEAKNQAAKLLAKLTAELPEEVVAAAQEQARQQELAMVVAALLV
jgi:tetratricopeptide (TPR) repeat protein